MTLDTFEIETPDTNRPARCARPDAQRQGLAARRYVSEELARRVLEFRQELGEIHRPESIEELQLVERFAIAQARVEECESAWDERLRWQHTHALELFDRGESQRFETDLVAWRASPHRMMAVFGQTWHSAIYLRDLWKCIVDAIEYEIAISYLQVKDLILALGSDWRVDRIDFARGRIMSAFLALEADPGETVLHWVNDSRKGRDDLATFDDDLERGHNFSNAAPSQEKARSFLKALAEEQHELATDLVKTTHSVYMRDRDRCAEVTTGHPLGDASDIRETLRIRRCLTTAQNRADKIERRLLALKKQRASRDIRTPKPTRQSDCEKLLQARESQAPSFCTTTAPVHSESLQVFQSKEGASLSRTGAHESELPSELLSADRPVRRPDPISVAKSWRRKAGLARKRQYPGEAGTRVPR